MFNDPKANCTVFAPTDKAYGRSLKLLGSKVGLVVQSPGLMSTIVQVCVWGGQVCACSVSRH
jgi:hypothetical protein